MSALAYLVSDLHLDPSHPEMTETFLRFLSGQARDAERLYLLGDIFEAWIGDDANTELMSRVARALREVSESGTKVFFMHGNRDFLLGKSYADRCGMALLPDPVVHDLGTPTVLSHGDFMCTDDVAYQAFRAKSRTKEWQAKILGMPLFVRRAIAAYGRWKSKRHQRSQMGIGMIGDVVEGEVLKLFASSSTRRMIHGHTHRPGEHHHRGDTSGVLLRIVLADWRGAEGEALRIAHDGSFERAALR